VLLFQKLCDRSANSYKNVYMTVKLFVKEKRFDIKSYKRKYKSRKSIKIHNQEKLSLFI